MIEEKEKLKPVETEISIESLKPAPNEYNDEWSDYILNNFKKFESGQEVPCTRDDFGEIHFEGRKSSAQVTRILP